jgi:hypothetical protein
MVTIHTAAEMQTEWLEGEQAGAMPAATADSG